MHALLAKSTGWAKGSGLALVLGILVLCIYGIWILSSDARRELDKLATARGETMQWSLAQSEVEFLAMSNAALAARGDKPASLQELRQRFDVFYSRVAVLRDARGFAPLREDPTAVSYTHLTLPTIPRWC